MQGDILVIQPPEQQHKGTHQNGRQAEIIVDVVDRLNAPVCYLKDQNDNQGVDKPCASLPHMNVHRLPDEIGPHIVGNAPHGIQRHQLDGGHHQVGLLSLRQRPVQGAQNLKVVHIEQQGHQKAEQHQSRSNGQLLHIHRPNAGGHQQRQLFSHRSSLPFSAARNIPAHTPPAPAGCAPAGPAAPPGTSPL